MADQFVQGDTAVGPGEAPPLPEGAATDLNAQAPAPEPQTQPPPPNGAVASPAPAGQGPVPSFQKGSTGFGVDEEKYLMSPTERPTEPIHAGLLDNGMIAPTPDVYAQLDALRAAAADPTAPPQAALLLQLVAEQLP